MGDYDLTNALREAVGWAADAGMNKSQIIDELREMIEEVEGDPDIAEVA